LLALRLGESGLDRLRAERLLHRRRTGGEGLLRTVERLDGDLLKALGRRRGRGVDGVESPLAEFLEFFEVYIAFTIN
jgi:hypothetical protein